jgi:hypothetical protein
MRWIVPTVLLGVLFAALPGWAACTATAVEFADVDADLCIYGATAAGVVAAVQAARQGNSVVLIDCDGWIGGLTTSGLGATDVGDKAAIGGLAREFYRRLRQHYDRGAAWTWQRREDFAGRGHDAGDDAAWTFEPSVAQQVLAAMLAEQPVRVARGERLERQTGVEKQGTRIAALRMESGRRFLARVYIDCSYEGDLMAAAGCGYRVGREANAVHGETLNGVQVEQSRFHQFQFPVDPFVRPGDPTSGVLAGIDAAGPGTEGAADHRVQAYCFRICATAVPGNRVPWPKPAGYDAAAYELLFRYFAAGSTMAPWHPVAVPNGKTDCNNNGAVSTDFVGGNQDYPEADYRRRAEIVDAHRRWQQGLLWTLANDDRVPGNVRAEFQRFGLAKDEFEAHGHWPPLLYVREARRLVGEAVVTEHHCTGKIVAADPVGMGAYAMDSHNVQRYVDAQGKVRNEGDVQVRVARPYGIPFGALVPRRRDCTNMLVPVCASATHIAYGSLRMEPVFMVLAQSAAIAAGLALAQGTAVQDVPYAELRARLLAAGQIVTVGNGAPESR